MTSITREKVTEVATLSRRMPGDEWDTKTERERIDLVNEGLRDKKAETFTSYLQSTDSVAMARFLANQPNVIGPLPYKAAYTDPDTGRDYPQVGLPGTEYACSRLRGLDLDPLPAGIEVCDARIGLAICGEWFGG